MQSHLPHADCSLTSSPSLNCTCCSLNSSLHINILSRDQSPSCLFAALAKVNQGNIDFQCTDPSPHAGILWGQSNHLTCIMPIPGTYLWLFTGVFIVLRFRGICIRLRSRITEPVDGLQAAAPGHPCIARGRLLRECTYLYSILHTHILRRHITAFTLLHATVYISKLCT